MLSAQASTDCDCNRLHPPTLRPLPVCLPASLLQLDGRVVGHVRTSLASAMVAHLRAIKAANLATEEQLTPGGQAVAAGSTRSSAASSDSAQLLPS